MLNRLLDDLRFPIGLLFSIFAAILLVMGVFSPEVRDGGVNLNLFAGAVMGAFALFMLGTSVLAARAAGLEK